MANSTPGGVPPLGIKNFFSAFVKAKGAIPVFIIATLLSSAIAMTVGVVPEILSDRYARLYHHYDGPTCSNFDHELMPEACRNGEDDAQEASAWATLLLNMLTLFFNPVVGSLSDVHGRRGMLIFGIILSTLSPMVLVLMLIIPTIDPFWFYVANSIVGFVSSISIMFAALSDSMPEEFRAQSFAMILAGAYGAFTLSPSLALIMNHFQVSLLSSVLVMVALLYTVVAFPETLPDSVAESNLLARSEQNNTDEDESGYAKLVLNTLTRPFREISILNRGVVMRLVAVGSFFSSMVHSTDSNLVIFYIEEHFNVRDKDIAQMFFVMGVLGVCFQGFLLQPLVKLLGEKGLLVTSFLSGTFHNFLYGVAKDKKAIYLALCLAQLTKTNYPVLSSLASKGASANEQGQVQGALSALNALSAAIGPLSMQFIYNRTKDNLGPGTMFLFASFLYFVGTVVVSFIPAEKETSTVSEGDAEQTQDNLEEPLLESDDSASTD
jgi:DHA1 family tetracycline resistance protein-like MFS transporter